MKKTIILLLLIVGYGAANSQEFIDYNNKLLAKALEKEGFSTDSKMEEISLPDRIAQSFGVNGKFFKVKKENISQYIYIGRVNSCRAGGCSNPSSTAITGHSEYFDYFILFNEEKAVQQVKVFNYQATHGQEITARGWLKQFEGHHFNQKLEVKKNIDAISGATISVYAITSDIESKTEILQNFL